MMRATSVMKSSPIARAAEQVEADLHARRDAAAGNDAAAVHHPCAADAAGRGNFGQPVNGDLSHVGAFETVRLFAIGRQAPVE